MLKRLKAQGISILVSTPYMDEANMCDRIALMQNGKILEIDSPQNIINRFDKNLYAVKSKSMFNLLNDLRAYSRTESCFAFGQYHHLVLNEEHPDLNELKSYLKNHTELEIALVKPGIEDRFMQLMKK
jgi:ABC-type multidrug transport system ATPase subunit